MLHRYFVRGHQRVQRLEQRSSTKRRGLIVTNSLFVIISIFKGASAQVEPDNYDVSDAKMHVNLSTDLLASNTINNQVRFTYIVVLSF